MSLNTDHLNKQAHVLAQLLRETASSEFVPRTDDAALFKLRDECEELSRETRKVRKAISHFSPLLAPEEEASLAALALKEERLKIEVSQWKERRANVPSKSLALIEADLHEQLQSSTQQLQELLVMLRREETDLIKQQQKEEEILSDMVNMKDTLIESLKTSQEISTSSLPPCSVEMLQATLQQRSSECKNITTQLERFIVDHLSDSKETTDKSHKPVTESQQAKMETEETETYLSLMDTITLLIDKTASHSSESFYISTLSIWPPDLQLLIQSGVVQRHPDNPSMIRITPFHR